MSRFRILLAALCGGLFFNAPAETVLHYSDHEPYGNMRTRFLQEVFFKNIADESQGRLRIEPHWGGEIAKAHGELAALAAGKMDMAVAVPEYSAKQLPRHQLFKGFLIGPSGAAQVEKIRQIYGAIPALTAEYEAQGLTPVLIATGYPVAFFSREPLANLEAIKGQSWRSASFWHRAFLENAGARPVNSPWGPETYALLASGQMQGLMVNIDSALDLGAPKHANHALVAKEFWLGHIYPIVIRTERWQALDEADRAAIGRAAEKSYAVLGEIMERSYGEILAKAREQGVQLRELTAAEVAAWGEASQYRRVLDEWAAEQEKNGVGGISDVLAQMKKQLLPPESP